MSNPSKSLIKTICSPTVEQLKTPAFLWGKAHENDGIAVYDHFMKNKSDADKPFQDCQVIASNVVVKTDHTICVLKKAGLLICEDYQWLGVSPDGYISCDCCGKGVIEVKCPFIWTDKNFGKK